MTPSLQDQRFEYHHRIKYRTVALGAIAVFAQDLQVIVHTAQRLRIHDGALGWFTVSDYSQSDLRREIFTAVPLYSLASLCYRRPDSNPRRNNLCRKSRAQETLTVKTNLFHFSSGALIFAMPKLTPQSRPQKRAKILQKPAESAIR